MAKGKQKDIIDEILSGKDDKQSPELEALDYLIYRSADDLPNGSSETETGETTWEESRGNVSIQVWKSKAKIRVKASPEIKKTLSISRIATIAMNAILEELKKEGK